MLWSFAHLQKPEILIARYENDVPQDVKHLVYKKKVGYEDEDGDGKEAGLYYIK